MTMREMCAIMGSGVDSIGLALFSHGPERIVKKLIFCMKTFNLFLLFIGLTCCGLALWLQFGSPSKIVSFLRIGSLPGDILIKRPGFTFYFPLMTCLVVSFLLRFGWWFWRKFLV
jgi:hypothetical protein